VDQVGAAACRVLFVALDVCRVVDHNFSFCKNQSAWKFWSQLTTIFFVQKAPVKFSFCKNQSAWKFWSQLTTIFFCQKAPV
jgi:hypothetical protein